MTDNTYKAFEYPNGVLKNKLNITNPQGLHEIEYENAADIMATMMKHPNKVKTNSIDDLCTIHRAMFKSLYTWAGVPRNQTHPPFDTEKEGHKFIPVGVLDNSAYCCNQELAEINKKQKPSKLDYANLLMDINDMHPFREGNGRSTKAFLQIFAKHHGQELEYPRNQKNLVAAMNALEPEQVAKFITVKDINDQPQKQHTINSNHQQQAETGLEF